MSTDDKRHIKAHKDNAERAKELADNATAEMQLARRMMERAQRVRRQAAFAPPEPIYRKIY